MMCSTGVWNDGRRRLGVLVAGVLAFGLCLQVALADDVKVGAASIAVVSDAKTPPAPGEARGPVPPVTRHLVYDVGTGQMTEMPRHDPGGPGPAGGGRAPLGMYYNFFYATGVIDWAYWEGGGYPLVEWSISDDIHNEPGLPNMVVTQIDFVYWAYSTAGNETFSAVISFVTGDPTDSVCAPVACSFQVDNLPVDNLAGVLISVTGLECELPVHDYWVEMNFEDLSQYDGAGGGPYTVLGANADLGESHDLLSWPWECPLYWSWEDGQASIGLSFSGELSAAGTGDCDGDGIRDLSLDLPCFIEVLLGINSDPGAAGRSDMNHDNSTNGDDIALFVDLILPLSISRCDAEGYDACPSLPEEAVWCTYIAIASECVPGEIPDGQYFCVLCNDPDICGDLVQSFVWIDPASGTPCELVGDQIMGCDICPETWRFTASP